jgi:hypothetical protein
MLYTCEVCSTRMFNGTSAGADIWNYQCMPYYSHLEYENDETLALELQCNVDTGGSVNSTAWR